ncbi:MAG TPA: hypothetical protein VMT34_12380 [Aggregatilineales bacterium]|nr:hypothetical protein [Aggregatilineales bacterium]
MHADQPFKPVESMLLMMFRWSIRNTTGIGMTVIVTPAAILPTAPAL